jgi:hypothetical protein
MTSALLATVALLAQTPDAGSAPTIVELFNQVAPAKVTRINNRWSIPCERDPKCETKVDLERGQISWTDGSGEGANSLEAKAFTADGGRRFLVLITTAERGIVQQQERKAWEWKKGKPVPAGKGVLPEVKLSHFAKGSCGAKELKPFAKYARWMLFFFSIPDTDTDRIGVGFHHRLSADWAELNDDSLVTEKDALIAYLGRCYAQGLDLLFDAASGTFRISAPN